MNALRAPAGNEGAAEESNMAADRFAAGQAGDGLVHHGLKNGGGGLPSLRPR